MKKLLPVLAMLLCNDVMGQSWLPENTNTGPVRIQDIIAQHGIVKNNTTEDDEEVPKGVIKENKDYHFERWVWYWKQHTDANGNLVPSIKTFQEWQAYEQRNGAANKLARTTGGNMSNWKFQGPDTSSGGYSGIGRINVIAFHPTDVNTFWIGSPGGGAWRTANAGTTWTCMTDQLPVLSVSAITFNPLNANTIYLCTGDRDGGDYSSVGILKSTNGGTDWDTTGLKWSTSAYMRANDLVINPLDTNCLTLATNYGIYRSRDGGATWTLKVDSGNFKQVLYNPADTNVMYASTAYYYYPGINNANVYRSTNGGATWTQVTNFTNATRVAIAVTAANPKIVKVLVANYNGSNANGLNGIYSSSDSGKTYRLTYAGDCTHNMLTYDDSGHGCGGQAWYDLCMVMNPIDSSKLYVGGVNSWYSSDGGSSWNLMTFWYDISLTPAVATAHADKHYMAINPLVSTNLYQCNDGGVYVTTNPTIAGAWVKKLSNGLGITEFYRNAVENDATFVLGGAQDNGTKRVDSLGTYYDIGGGDGMQCQIDPVDPTTYYYATQYGNIVKHDAYPPYNHSISDTFHSSGAWVTPYTLLPSCNTCIVAGYKKVFLSVDQGGTWSAISDTFSTNKNDRIERLGLTAADANTIYVLVDNQNNIFYTQDLGVTWKSIFCPYSSYGNMSDIRVDSKNKDHFWVTFSGYDTIRVAEYNKASGGWKSISQNLPNVPISCIVQDTSNGYLYAGSDVGVFYRGDTMTMWHAYNTGLPSVRASDLGINYATGEIWAATFGRGMWKSAKQGKPTGISIIPFAENALVVSPNPNKGNFTVTGIKVADKKVNLRLVDNTGRIVWQGENVFDATCKLQVNTTNVPRGSYVLVITSGTVSVGKQKVVVY